MISLRLVVSQACDYPYSQAYGLSSSKLLTWEAAFGGLILGFGDDLDVGWLHLDSGGKEAGKIDNEALSLGTSLAQKPAL